MFWDSSAIRSVGRCAPKWRKRLTRALVTTILLREDLLTSQGGDPTRSLQSRAWQNEDSSVGRRDQFCARGTIDDRQVNSAMAGKEQCP